MSGGGGGRLGCEVELRPELIDPRSPLDDFGCWEDRDQTKPIPNGEMT